MSKLFLGFLNAVQLSALHAAGHIVTDAGISEGQKLVATLKTTSIGAAVTDDIQALTDKDMTGAQKFEQVVANTAPLVLSYATGGGLPALAVDAGGVARELVQSLFNDLKAAAPKVAATAVEAAIAA